MFRAQRITIVALTAAALLIPAFLAAQPVSTHPASRPAVLRVKAGAAEPFTDPAGNKWAADQGFADGDIVAREDGMEIHGTDMPAFYRNEHYDMSAWSADLPNGTYTVRLYFCETYEEINDKGLRVFTFAMPGYEVKNFDIFKEAGGFAKPVIKTFENVKVTDGKLKLTFTAMTQSPAINGIEVFAAGK